jgi:hypothetical protein
MAALQTRTELTNQSAINFAAGFNTPAAGLANLSIIGPLVAFALVSNRVYWRLKTLGKVWYDDGCIIISLVSLLSTAVFMTHGYLRHFCSLNLQPC